MSDRTHHRGRHRPWLFAPDSRLGPVGQEERYVVLQRLGRGAYGEVYKAEDQTMNRSVALKFLLLDQGDADKVAARLEAQSLCRINHPNVVTVHDVVFDARILSGESLTSPFLVMEYIEGITLQDRLDHAQKRRARLDPPEALDIFRPVGAALVAAHRAGLLHRDLKPSNIMLGNDELVRLIDFGVAQRRAQGGSPFGRPSTDTADSKAGTPYYQAPEVLNGMAADVRSDIFAFGVSLFETLALRRPVEGVDTVRQLTRRLCSDEPLPSLALFRPDISPALVDVVDRCLALDPQQRFNHADELLRELDQIARYSARSLPERPYLGLKTFTTHEQGVFFGRDEEVARILARLRLQRSVCLAGESGSGKSSLALAGVSPAVIAGELKDGQTWTLATTTPGRAPMARLAAVFARFFDEPPNEVSAALTRDPASYLTRLQVGLRPGHNRRRPAERRALLLVVDQLEELVTVCDDSTEREAFGRVLEAALDRPLRFRLLLTVRHDFHSGLVRIPGMREALESVHLVRPLDGEALRSAVVSPARAFGYDFENEAMVDQIVDEVAGRPGSLPLLQFGLDRLWRRRSESLKRIPAEALAGMEGIGSALAREADRVYRELDEAGLGLPTRRILLHLLTPEGTKRARTATQLTAAADDDRGAEAVAQLRASRLVVGDDRALELAHEALTESWKLLKTLAEQTRTDREVAYDVAHAADKWIRHERAAEQLLTGDDLDRATALLNATSLGGVTLTGETTLFVQHSLNARQTRGRQREWAARRRRIVIAAAALLFVVFSLTAISHLLTVNRRVVRAKNEAEKAAIKAAAARKRAIAAKAQLKRKIHDLKEEKQARKQAQAEAQRFRADAQNRKKYEKEAEALFGRLTGSFGRGGWDGDALIRLGKMLASLQKKVKDAENAARKVDNGTKSKGLDPGGVGAPDPDSDWRSNPVQAPLPPPSGVDHAGDAVRSDRPTD